jgi:hypothetical protein
MTFIFVGAGAEGLDVDEAMPAGGLAPSKLDPVDADGAGADGAGADGAVVPFESFVGEDGGRGAPPRRLVPDAGDPPRSDEPVVRVRQGPSQWGRYDDGYDGCI